jgi:hypothetical protein
MPSPRITANVVLHAEGPPNMLRALAARAVGNDCNVEYLPLSEEDFGGMLVTLPPGLFRQQMNDILEALDLDG